MNRRTQIISGAIAVLAVSGIVTSAALTATSISATPAPTPTVTITDTTPYGLAASSYVEKLAASETARRAAVQAEADRVATEQAAAAAQAQADAERAAAEQAQNAQRSDGGGGPGDAPTDPWADKKLVPWVVDSNPENTQGGYWDTSQCPTQSGSTGPDGRQYCD